MSSMRACDSPAQDRHALYDFEKERWRRGEADSHPFDRDIYPPEKGTY